MAIAHVCDCCGAFYSGERTTQIVVGMSPACLSDTVGRYDICPDCESSFLLWLESRNPDHKSAFEDKEDQ